MQRGCLTKAVVTVTESLPKSCAGKGSEPQVASSSSFAAGPVSFTDFWAEPCHRHAGFPNSSLNCFVQNTSWVDLWGEADLLIGTQAGFRLLIGGA
jgi:hypothetical protein